MIKKYGKQLMKKLVSVIFSSLFILTAVGYFGTAEQNEIFEKYNNDPVFINLKASQFDPLLQPPDISSDLKYSEETNYFLLQCTGPIQSEWVINLVDTGVHILGYIPEYTYLVHFENKIKSLVDELTFVRWTGIYHPAYKIDHVLLNKKGPVELNVEYFNWNNDPFMSSVIVETIENMGGTIIREEKGVNVIVLEIDASLVDEIAFIPEVGWIDEYFEPEALMDNIRVFTGASSPLHEYGFNGSGIVGEVKDNGIDQNHVEFEGRLIATDGNIDESSHGTSTFGIVFAKGIEARAKGMMPGGQGVFASWGVGRKQSIANLVNNWGGVFQSNSWSSGSMDGSYGSNTRQNDDSVFEYDVSMLYATGNGGSDSSISQEAAAKNVISVGAVNHYNNRDRTDDRHTGNQGNKGPTADGRIKPDLVGPYDSIFTTTTNDRYTSGFGGTSGATPVVAGAAGLVYEMYRENHFKNNPAGVMPHASTVKALLIADAYQYQLNMADRYAQGWGLVDVGMMYNIGKNHLIDDESQPLRTGETKIYKIAPITATPLKITLVWTDVPGSTSASKHLINDLNLKVIDPDGNIYLGNSGLETALWSQPGGDPDNLNNVENVFIEKPMAGEWTIEVIGENIPMDGLPATREIDQGYALVASGVPKYEHDIKVQSIGYPKFVGTGENVPINTTIVNIGTNNEVNVKVELQIENITINTSFINSLKVGESSVLEFIWIPEQANQYEFSIYVEPLTGETAIWDNRRSGIISARFISGKVLVDDGHGTDKNHDLYYFYLETTGPEMYRVHHTAQAITSPILDDYDVFVSANPTQSYSPNEALYIADFIKNGGGMLVVGESESDIYNQLTNYAGIEWGNPYLFQYDGETTEINSHEITENVSSLFFNSPQVPLSVNSPAEEIVYTYGGVVYNRVTVAATEFGQGKIVAVADTDCLDTQFINTADNRIFGQNIIKWLSNARPVSIIGSPVVSSQYLSTDLIVFDGNASYDPDGKTLTYEWSSDLDGIIGNSVYFTRSLNPGWHTITLQVQDEGGKIGSNEVFISVLALPTVDTHKPIDGALINGAVEISGSATDADGSIETVEVKIDDRKWQKAEDTSKTNDWSTWKLTWDTADVFDGNHMISVQAFDNDGLGSGIINVTVDIDNTPASIISGPEVSSITDTSATIEWETDEIGISIVEYGTDLTYGLSESIDSPTTLHTVELTVLSPITQYHFRVITPDQAGNTPAVSPDRTFTTKRTPDFTPPVITISSPLTSEIITGSVNVLADASDNQGISKVEFYIDDQFKSFDLTPEYSWLWETDDGSYPDGLYTIKVKAIDLSGNEASDEILVRLDNEIIPPSIISASVEPGTIRSGEDTGVLFTISIQDPENRLGLVIIDLSPIGGSFLQVMYDDGTNGDELSGDNTYSFLAMVADDISDGEKLILITATYDDFEFVEADVELEVLSQEGSDLSRTVSESFLEQWIFWIILMGMVGVIIGASIYLVYLGDRQRRTEVIEVEPLDFHYRR